MLILVLYSCLNYSYWLGFREPPNPALIFNYIVETFFFIDFCLNFITATKDPITELETNKQKLIDKNYLKGSFFLDLICLLPS